VRLKVGHIDECFKQIVVAEVQEPENVTVLFAWHITDFRILVIDCDGFRVMRIVRLKSQVNLRPYIEMLDYIQPFVIAKARNVKINQAPGRFVFRLHHVLLSVIRQLLSVNALPLTKI